MLYIDVYNSWLIVARNINLACLAYAADGHYTSHLSATIPFLSFPPIHTQAPMST